MQKAGISTLFILSLLMVTACEDDEREQAQQQGYEMQLQQQIVETTESFRNEVADILDEYFDLKDQLVLSEAEEAAVVTANLIQQTENVDSRNLSEETETLWSSFTDEIIRYTSRLMDETEIDEQRIHFESLSGTMIHITDTFRPAGYEIFVQSCPMVRDGTAEWLSREEEIENPYHGDRMLNCGEVLRRI